MPGIVSFFFLSNVSVSAVVKLAGLTPGSRPIGKEVCTDFKDSTYKHINIYAYFRCRNMSC